MIPMMVGAGLSVVGGLLGSRSARQQRLAAQQAEELRRRAASEYAGGMTNLAAEYQRRAKFTPVGVTSGFGRAYQGSDGTMISELSPEYQAARGNMFGLAGQELARLKNFDPNALAAERFRTMQGLLAPDRAMQAEGMFSTLKAKGLTGLSVDDGSGRSYNPLMGGLQRGWADADTRLGLESQDWAENQRRTGLGLVSGLYGQAANFDQLGLQNLDRSQNWSNLFNTANMNSLNNEMNMHQDALRAVLGSYNQNPMNQSTIMNGTGNNSAMWGNLLNSAGSALMGGGGMMSGITGMFGHQAMPPSPWMLDTRARGGGAPGEG